MTDGERLGRGHAWLGWYMGEFAYTGDYLAAGKELLGLYCELGRHCLSFERAQGNLADCWGSGSLPVPAARELILDCWKDGLHHPMDALVTLTACVGALYVLCVEGRVPREVALTITDAWQAAAHPERLIVVSAPGGTA
jgi:hypothetical protein